MTGGSLPRSEKGRETRELDEDASERIGIMTE